MNNQINYYEEKLKYEIDSWDLKIALDNNDKTMAIDTRSSEAYEYSHIPSAINIPHKNMNKDTTSHLDRRITYVTYCDGIGCNASTKGALNMRKLGFKVKELLGGLDWWIRDGHKTNGKNSKEEQNISCGC